MQTNWKMIARRIALTSVALMLPFMAVQANAADTASGSLTVTATVTSSIQLLFNTATNGITLSGANSNSATLAFGSLSEYGTPPSNVTISTTTSLCSNCFVASTPVSIVVNAADSSSANFTLTASVTAPTHGEVLGVGSSAALSTNAGSPTQITTSGAYGSTGNALAVNLGIPTASTGAATYSDVISFVATAN